MDGIEDLIDAIKDENYTDANKIMGDLLSTKQSDALDQAKINIASKIYDGEEEVEEPEEYDDDEEYDEEDE